MFQPIYHVSVSPTDGNGPTQGQRKTLTRVGFEPNCRANAHMVYGLKHQHFTSHSITLFVLNISATRPYVALQRNPSLYLHIHCRAINIFIFHDLLPSAPFFSQPTISNLWRSVVAPSVTAPPRPRFAGVASADNKSASRDRQELD